MILSCCTLSELTRIFLAEVRLRPCTTRRSVTPPRTSRSRVSSRVRVRAVCQDRRGVIVDSGLLKNVIFVGASDAVCGTLLWFDTVKERPIAARRKSGEE